jgi:hypothetical protein
MLLLQQKGSTKVVITFFWSAFLNNSDFGLQLPYFCILRFDLCAVTFDELFDHFSELHDFLLHRLITVFHNVELLVQLIVGC